MFEHLEKLNVSGKTAKMYIQELGTEESEAYLELRIADESNKEYWSTTLKMGAQRAEKKTRRGAAGKIDPALLRQMRAMDVKLFPLYVIVGWGGVFSSAGEEVVFSQENAKLLVDQLVKSAPRIFDDIRAFAQIPANFLPEEELEPADLTNLVGNSASDSSGT